MAQPEGEGGADAHPQEDCLLYVLCFTHAEDIGGNVGQGIWIGHFVGAAVTSKVRGDDLEEGREMGDLLENYPVVERIAVEHHHRHPLAVDFVVGVHAVGADVRHRSPNFSLWPAGASRRRDGDRM